MAELFDKQAETYLQARPIYPGEWYLMLATRSSHHSLLGMSALAMVKLLLALVSLYTIFEQEYGDNLDHIMTAT